MALSLLLKDVYNQLLSTMADKDPFSKDLLKPGYHNCE